MKITISTTYDLTWRIKDVPHYGFTKNGICINTRTNKIIKKTLCGNSRGYCINGKFESEKNLRLRLEKHQSKELEKNNETEK